MHEEGSNIFLKTRSFGLFEASYLLFVLLLLFWLLNNQIQIVDLQVSKIVGVAGFILGIASLFVFRVFESLIVLYLSLVAVLSPLSNFIDFFKSIFYEVPMVIFVLLPSNLFA